ncbi:MAG TPA: phenylalanine--tRNA ligase beta subunit-related protein [Thermomicrobiaceae bacterium]|nr:phenylalanine--tRNA ligase beta subunit-related protein [Thermomicrobiaceae bacterium]
MPLFSIDEAIFAAVPNARFAAVVLRGADNTGVNRAVEERLRAAEEAVRRAFAGQDVKAHPNLAIWRETFGERGWTPSKYLSSIEALVRRVAKGGELPRINPAVDLGNSLSLRYLVPLGTHDLAGAPEGISVRLSRPEDRFLPMGEQPAEIPEPGEIVYASGGDIRTRRWVWRQSGTALVGPEARDILFPLDGFAPRTEEAVRRAAEELAELAPALLGGTTAVYHLGPAQRAVP